MPTKNNPGAEASARGAGGDGQEQQHGTATATAPQAEELVRPQTHARLARLLAGRARVVIRPRDGGPAITVSLDDGEGSA